MAASNTLNIVEGDNILSWPTIDFEINSTNIPEVISGIIGEGVATTKLPNGMWVGSLTMLETGNTYTFQSTGAFEWNLPDAPPPEAPPYTYDENFHPLDFNKDNNIDLLDAQLGAQLFNPATAEMVVKYIQDENPFDYNGDGGVDIADVTTAAQAGIPEHILVYMNNLILNPPYNPEAEPQMNGSTYHPLDINQDGNVDVMDLVVLGTSNVPESAREIVAGMIQRYSLDQNPYDINQDGNVDILDITTAVQAGVPENILMDMQNNLYTQAPTPEPIVPEPGLYEHLYSNGEYADAIKLIKWTGPIHKEVAVNGVVHFFTGAIRRPTRNVLIKITDLPNPAIVRDAEGFKHTRPFMSNGGGEY